MPLFTRHYFRCDVATSLSQGKITDKPGEKSSSNNTAESRNSRVCLLRQRRFSQLPFLTVSHDRNETPSSRSINLAYRSSKVALAVASKPRFSQLPLLTTSARRRLFRRYLLILFNYPPLRQKKSRSSRLPLSHSFRADRKSPVELYQSYLSICERLRRRDRRPVVVTCERRFTFTLIS